MSQNAHLRSMGGGGADPSSERACECPDAPPNPISLVVPRPDHERATNLYVDVPFRHKVSPTHHHPRTMGPRTPQTIPTVHGAAPRSTLDRHAKAPPKHTPQRSGTLNKAIKQDPVACQPASMTFTKYRLDQDSIICLRCGRCRCEACAVPRKPTGKCKFSSSEVVDCLSCLCCVKGVLYHCGSETHDEHAAMERPCSCSGSDACLRWSCLLLSVLPLPCLLCYWPLTGLRALVDKTYEHYSHGCRCHASPESRRRTDDPLPPPPSAEKRLLHDCT